MQAKRWIAPTPSHIETFTAAAGPLGVGVHKREFRLHRVLNEVHVRADQEHHSFGVNKNLHT